MAGMARTGFRLGSIGAFLSLAGCAGPGGATPQPKPSPSPLAIEAAQIAVAAAEERLASAEVDLSLQEADNRLAVEAARSALRKARSRLQLLETVDGKRRIDEAALAVRRAQDAIDDRTEELEQLKKMYADTELADDTKELVIRRSERDIARSRETLALQQANHTKVSKEVAEERESLAFDLLRAEKEVEQAERKAENGSRGKRAALLEAKRTLLTARDALRKEQEGR